MTSWTELAEQARALAELADRYGALPPADLAPTDELDPLADLDGRAAALAATVGACRVATWQALADENSLAEVGRLWRVSRQAVSQRLKAAAHPS